MDGGLFTSLIGKRNGKFNSGKDLLQSPLSFPRFQGTVYLIVKTIVVSYGTHID